MITAAQIRAARALVTWKQIDLAKSSGVSEMSIKNIERGETDPRVSTLNAIRAALEAAGVIFIDDEADKGGPGVRLKPGFKPKVKVAAEGKHRGAFQRHIAGAPLRHEDDE